MGKGFLYELNDWLSFARDEYFGFTIAVLLVCLAVASSLRMYFSARTAKQETRRAFDAIEDLEGPLQFTEYFGDVDEKLKAERRFGNTWSEFSKTLIPPLDHIDSPEFRVYRSTKRPNDYFDSTHVLKDVRPLFLESENLIGLGLIFTFLGLIAALLHAGLNLGSANADAVGAVIKELLSTAGAKFFASLGGVGGALIQTVCKVSVSESAENELKRFITKLESLLPFANLEKIAAEQYAHAVRQTARLEQMGTEITLAIGSRIESALTAMPELMKGAMTSAMQPTNDRLEDLSNGISSSNADAMAALVDQFTKQIQGAGEKTMNSVVGQLDALAGTLDQTVGQLASSNAEIRTTLTELLAAMKASGSNFEGSIQGSAEAAAKNMTEVTAAVTGALNQLIGRLDEQHSQTEKAIEGLIQTFTSAGNDAATRIGTSSATSAEAISVALQRSIESVLAKADEAGRDMATSIKGGVDAAGQAMSEEARRALAETSNSISESMKTVTVALEQWREATIAATGSMGQVNSALLNHRASIVDVNSRLVESGVVIGASSQTLRDVMGPLSVLSTELNQSTNALRTLVDESMSRVSEMGAVTKQSAAEISRAITGMVSAWEAQSVHLNRADQEIEKAFLSVVRNLEESLGTLSSFSKALNESLGSSIRDLGAIASEVADAVEALGSRR